MSIATIDATKYGEQIRAAVTALLGGKIGPVQIPRLLTLTIQTEDDHKSIKLTWPQKVEVDLSGINPDLLRARCFPDHAIVDLRISNIRINY